MTDTARFDELSAVVCKAYETAYGTKPSLDTEFASADEQAAAFFGEIGDALENANWFYDAQDVFHDNECELRDIVQALVDVSPT